MAIVKVSWSGGKDSTCACLLHLERGDKVIACCYVPMFTTNIPLIQKKHYDFILSSAEKLKKMGAEVHIVSGMTYYDFVNHRTTQGKNKGKIFGFPLPVTGMCGFKNYSKIKSLDNLDVGYYDYQDIGIAFDEVSRHGQLNDKLRSILCEEKYTELMALEKCRTFDLLSPLYKTAKRDGCALCPNASPEQRNAWFTDYPEAIPILIELQNIVKKERPERYPLRHGQYFINTNEKNIGFINPSVIIEASKTNQEKRYNKMTREVTIIGYRPISKKGTTDILGYEIHALDNSRVFNHFGERAYIEYVSADKLKNNLKVEPFELIGARAIHYGFIGTDGNFVSGYKDIIKKGE